MLTTILFDSKETELQQVLEAKLEVISRFLSVKKQKDELIKEESAEKEFLGVLQTYFDKCQQKKEFDLDSIRNETLKRIKKKSEIHQEIRNQCKIEVEESKRAWTQEKVENDVKNQRIDEEISKAREELQELENGLSREKLDLRGKKKKTEEVKETVLRYGEMYEGCMNNLRGRLIEVNTRLNTEQTLSLQLLNEITDLEAQL